MKGTKLLFTLAMILLIVPTVFAGNIERNYFYEFTTNNPVNNVQGLVFTCTGSSCTTVNGGAWYNQNSGANNRLDIEYPGTASLTYYAEYFYADGYIPNEFVSWDQGDGNVYSYDSFFYKANDCHSPVDSLAITNTIYANEPMVINYEALVDSTVTSAFRMSSAPPYYVPSGFDDHYSALTDVTLQIYDGSNNLVHQETQQLNLFADSEQEVTFDWTPTTSGNGYRAIVSTDVIDNQCASATTQSASKTFNVLPARPQNECYTLLNNLEYDPAFPVNGVDTVEFTYEKISNYAANDYSKTAIPTDVTYTLRRGQSDPSGAIVYSDAQTLAASSTDSFTQFSYNWLADQGVGWYTMYVTGVGNSALCNGVNNHAETLEVEIYVESPPMVNVIFYIDDNDNGNPIQGAVVTMNGDSATTDADGRAMISNVPGLLTHAYTVTHANYNPLSGSEYIPEVDHYMYLSMMRLNNDGPQFTTTPVTTACVNQAYSYDADAVDPNGDTVTYSLFAGPSGMTVDATTGVVSWTPSSTGTNAVSIEADDGLGANNFQTYTVDVQDCSPNTAPQITTTPPAGIVCIGDSYTYDVDYTDAEGDAATFSLTTAPSGMTVDAATGVISWTVNSVGHNAVTVRATDGRSPLLMDQQAYTVTAVDCSLPLVATANDQTCFPGETIYMNGGATGGLPPYTYAWDLDNDGTHEAQEFAPAFTCGTTIGTQYTVELLVDDDAGQQDTDTATITVVQYSGPTITSTPVTFAYPDEEYQYDVDAFDPDGDAITYTLDAASLALGMIINPTNGLIQYTPVNSEVGNVYDVSVTATSVDGSDTQDFSVTVQDRPEGFGFYVNDLYVSAKVAGGEYVNPGEEMLLIFRLENQGNEDFEGVQILTYVDDMGMYARSGPFSIDNGEELDKRVYMDVPNNAQEGTNHWIRVIISSELGWREVYREFTVQ